MPGQRDPFDGNAHIEPPRRHDVGRPASLGGHSCLVKSRRAVAGTAPAGEIKGRSPALDCIGERRLSFAAMRSSPHVVGRASLQEHTRSPACRAPLGRPPTIIFAWVDVAGLLKVVATGASSAARTPMQVMADMSGPVPREWPVPPIDPIVRPCTGAGSHRLFPSTTHRATVAHARTRVAVPEPAANGQVGGMIRHAQVPRRRCTGGLRRSEPAGLRWADVDIDADAAMIEPRLIAVGRVISFGPPNTAASGWSRSTGTPSACCASTSRR